MTVFEPPGPGARRPARARIVLVLAATALAGAVPAARASLPSAAAAAPMPVLLHHSHAGGAPGKTPASASLEECVSSASQEGRSASFAGEMSMLPGAVRMEIRIDLLERAPEELGYHRVAAPGLGVWRGAAPGVKTYRYRKQVTNLAAPASYRGLVRFRWLNARGRLVASSELRTHACSQTPLSSPPPPAGGSLN
jgi:hypothetical protein